jgi:hypothetical protein
MTDDMHDTLAHLAAGALGLPAPGCPDCNETFTRREHLTHDLVTAGVAASLAIETVSSTSSRNPEWDMEELLTTREWVARYARAGPPIDTESAFRGAGLVQSR